MPSNTMPTTTLTQSSLARHRSGGRYTVGFAVGVVDGREERVSLGNRDREALRVNRGSRVTG